MNEVFIPKTSFIAYLLLVHDKCRLVVKNIFLVLFLPITLKFLNVNYYSLIQKLTVSARALSL